MIEAILEVFFGFFFEIVFETFFEILAELGFTRIEKAARSSTIGPFFRAGVYGLLGIIVGLISYYVFPVHLLQNAPLRIAGAVLSTISAGLMLCLVSWFVVRKDRFEPFWSTEKFLQGIVFGSAYSLTRAFFIG